MADDIAGRGVESNATTERRFIAKGYETDTEGRRVQTGTSSIYNAFLYISGGRLRAMRHRIDEKASHLRILHGVSGVINFVAHEHSICCRTQLGIGC
jgi:hypothetical protein